MQNKYALPGLLTHYSRTEPHFDLLWEYKTLSWLFGVDRKLCPKGHCSAKVMPNSDPEGQIFVSTPNSHGRFFSLNTLSVFIAFCHFKCETFTNILIETQFIYFILFFLFFYLFFFFFCSCGYNYIINLVQRLQLHVFILGRVAIS